MNHLDDEELLSIEIEPTAAAKHSIIWLHGLGADGNDFAPLVPELRLPNADAIRFIFPHAPIMPVTINGGYAMRAWYDIRSIDFASDIDHAGMTRSRQQILQLIAREQARGIPTNHIILGGFSQGGVMALFTGLCYDQPLAGIIALSSYLPAANPFLQTTAPANRATPLFLAHGTQDMLVSYALGKAAYAALREAGYQVEWHSYEMAHSVCADEVADIKRWIAGRC